MAIQSGTHSAPYEIRSAMVRAERRSAPVPADP
jgi:hypothetical protein